MLAQYWTEPCGACGCRGYQRNIQTGMNEKCHVCGGSGKRIRSNYDNLPPGVYCSVSGLHSSGSGGYCGVMQCSQ
jgi:hypothetical protein